MPSPEVKEGDANAHREPTDPDDEVEVEATTGGGDDGDPPDDPDGADQAHGGDDNGSLGGVLTNKRVIALLVLVALIGAYFYYQGGSGNRNRGSPNGGPPRTTADSPDELDEAFEQSGAPGDRPFHVPHDDADPLAADGYVLEHTSIFPSISGREGAE